MSRDENPTQKPAPQTTEARAEYRTDALAGVLERVTYHNEENGYTVGRLAVEGMRDLVT